MSKFNLSISYLNREMERLSMLLEEKNEKKEYHKNEISKIEEQLKEYSKNISSIQESINLLKQKKE